MADAIKLLDVVALAMDLPQHKLSRGQVGTVIEVLAPGVLEVEFSGDDGRIYASAALNTEQLILLRYHPAHTA